MARPVRRRQLIAGTVVLAIVAAAVVAVVAATSGTGRSAAPTATAPTTSAPIGVQSPPTTAVPVGEADVAAARACRAFTVYLVDAEQGRVPAAAGRALADDAAVLLRGTRSVGGVEPRWAPLGADIVAAAEDIVQHRSEALRSDGARAGAECRQVPATAGGGQRGG